MDLTRRGFLGLILATACAPAIVRADSLIRIVPRNAAVLPWSATRETMLFERAMRERLGNLAAYERAEWMAATLRAIVAGAGVGAGGTYEQLARDLRAADYRPG